jgi:MinD superfamily P-loop ATPase
MRRREGTAVSIALRPEIIRDFHETPFSAPLIGVTGGKGGVGKSTVAINLAAALAAQGWRTALIDADVDAPNCALLLGLPLEQPCAVTTVRPIFDQSKCSDCQKCVKACGMNSLFRVRAGSIALMGECNGCEACFLVCPAEGAISRGLRSIGATYKSAKGLLTLYTGALQPGLAESAHVVTAVKERAFAEAEQFDILLVDTAPGTHCNVIGALKGAAHALAVTEPTPLGAHDLGLILSLLTMFAVSGSVVVNRADLPGRIEEVRQTAAEHGAEISASINMDKDMLASYVDGVPVTEAKPDSPAAAVFSSMAAEIAARHIKRQRRQA